MSIAVENLPRPLKKSYRAAMDISDRGMDQHHPAKILDRFLKYGSNLNSV
jgi:hypothetical protein